MESKAGFFLTVAQMTLGLARHCRSEHHDKKESLTGAGGRRNVATKSWRKKTTRNNGTSKKDLLYQVIQSDLFIP